MQKVAVADLKKLGYQPATNPKAAGDFLFRGVEKHNRGDHPGAIFDFTQAIRLQPDYAYAYYNRGVAYDDLGDKQRAIVDFTQTIKLKPNFTDAYARRSRARFGVGDYEGERADNLQAIKTMKTRNNGAHARRSGF